MIQEKTCLDCVRYTWNWSKHWGCTGEKDGTITNPSEQCFKQIRPEQAKKRLKVLGPIPEISNGRIIQF